MSLAYPLTYLLAYLGTYSLRLTCLPTTYILNILRGVWGGTRTPLRSPAIRRDPPADTPAPWSLVPGPWSLVPGPWSLVPGPWSLVPGPWSLVPGPWSLVPGPWSVVPGPWSLVPGPWSLVHGPLYPSSRYQIMAQMLFGRFWLQNKDLGPFLGAIDIIFRAGYVPTGPGG